MGLQIEGCQRPLTRASSAVHSRPWHTHAPGRSGCSLSSDSAGTSYLRLRLCFSPHLLICTHPRSCQPAGLPPVLQSLHPNPRRRKLQLGDPSSSGTCFSSHILPLWWSKHSLVTSASPLNTLLEHWTLPFFLSGSLFSPSPFSSLAFTFFLFSLVFPFLLPFGGVFLRES